MFAGPSPVGCHKATALVGANQPAHDREPAIAHSVQLGTQVAVRRFLRQASQLAQNLLSVSGALAVSGPAVQKVRQLTLQLLDGARNPWFAPIRVQDGRKVRFVELLQRFDQVRLDPIRQDKIEALEGTGEVRMLRTDQYKRDWLYAGRPVAEPVATDTNAEETEGGPTLWAA